ncbi:MAG: ribosome maturation factor RimM [Gammaproteobacteria bacterium]
MTTQQAPNNDYLIMGQFGAPHGVKGWIKVISHAESTQALLDYQPWHLLTPQNTWQLIEIEEVKSQTNKLWVKLKACDNREEAHTFTNKMIYVSRDNLPPTAEGTYYWADLEGLEVFNENGDLLGSVDHMMETGANDVMVIKDKEKQHLVPFLMDRVIKQVDIENKKIVIDWDFYY